MGISRSSVLTTDIAVVGSVAGSSVAAARAQITMDAHQSIRGYERDAGGGRGCS